MRKILVMTLVAGLGFTAPVIAGTTETAPVYDLLFREGTLDNVGKGSTLLYTRDVTMAAKPEIAERESGQIALSVAAGDDAMAQLQFRQGDKHRGMGRFPASIGNPMIMVFYEGVIRDMAEAAGGSPFYIRNRVKEALVQPSEIIEGQATIDGRQVPTVTVQLMPFADDPNRDRMQGFGDLELRVTMSEEVPGWYVSLVAETAKSDGAGVYRSTLEFDRLEPGK